MMKKMINKCSHGRKKIPISKIAKRTSLQVTFSKRRSGLFKKASELCTLCGVEVAIIVFSPANKPFSFGHPEVESIIDRFLARNPTFEIPLADSSYSCSEAQNNATSADRELNKQLTKISNLVEAERKRGESLDKMRKASDCWWEKAVEELGLDEIQILMDAMEELKKNVNEQGNRVFMETTNTKNVDISSSLFMMNNNIADHHQLFESIPNCDQIVGSCSGPIDIPRGAYEIGYAADGLF